MILLHREMKNPRGRKLSLRKDENDLTRPSPLGEGVSALPPAMSGAGPAARGEEKEGSEVLPII